MTAARGYDLLSFQQYVELEMASPTVRYELVGGTAFAMTGGTLSHARLATALALLLGAGARSAGCRLYVADARLRVGDLTSYYPDVMVCCGSPSSSEHYETAPCLVAEVLSPSTADIDRREKRLAYLAIPSLEQYLIVDPAGVVEVYRPDGTHLVLGRGEQLAIPCADALLLVDELFA